MTEKICSIPQDWNTYYKETSPLLQRYLSRLIGNPAVAEDLAQEAFERAFRKSATFRQGADFTTWVYSIARNALKDYLRRRKVQGNFTCAEENDLITPEDECIGRETEARFQYFLLNHKNQKAVEALLLDMQDYSDQEIAEMLSGTVDGVKTRLHRTRRELTEILQK